MPSVDTTRWDFAFKDRYPSDEVVKEIIVDCPALGLIPKEEGFDGRRIAVPIVYAKPTGRSGNISVALARRQGSSGVDFLVTRKKNYGIVSIENEVAEASATNPGAFLDAMETEMSGVIEALKQSMGAEVYGDGSGSKATISTISSTVLTLTAWSDVSKFEVDQYIVFADSTTDALRASGAAAKVTAVDRDSDTPTITIDAVPSGVVVGDIIFHEGDYEAASDRTRFAGFAAWCPTTAPTSGDSHYGVDRSVDVVRLAGNRVACAGLPVNEALVRLCTRVAQNSGSLPDHVFISHDRYERLINLLGSKVEYTSANAYQRADIGFEGVMIRHTKGSAKVFADAFCPATQAWGMALKFLKLKSLGAAPHAIERNGQIFHMESLADAWQARYGVYGNVICRKPAAMGVATSFGS